MLPEILDRCCTSSVCSGKFFREIMETGCPTTNFLELSPTFCQVRLIRLDFQSIIVRQTIYASAIDMQFWKILIVKHVILAINSYLVTCVLQNPEYMGFTWRNTCIVLTVAMAVWVTACYIVYT